MKVTNSAEELPLVLSVRDLQKILHIGHCSAYALVNSGAIRSFRIGKNIRIHREDFVEYLKHASTQRPST